MIVSHDEVACLAMQLTAELVQMELRAAALKVRILSVEGACARLLYGSLTCTITSDKYFSRR